MHFCGGGNVPLRGNSLYDFQSREWGRSGYSVQFTRLSLDLFGDQGHSGSACEYFDLGVCR